MKSIKEICKEMDIASLEQQVADINNQINKLEDKSTELSSRIILAKRQLDLMKGNMYGTERI